MKTKILTMTALALGLFLPISASATPISTGTVYNYTEDTTNMTQGARVGTVTNISTSYSTNSQFSWEYTITPDSNGRLSNGFFLVVNNGGNPKHFLGELAIIYGDFATGDISIYEYNTRQTSYQNTDGFLGSFNGALDITNVNGLQTAHFSLDVAEINALTHLGSNWRGIQFDESLGYWFHPFISTNFETNDAGHITAFSKVAQGWVDTAYKTTTTSETPEPSSILLLLSGIVGLSLRKRHQRA